MVPVNPGLFLKITGTGKIITKKGPGFAGTGIPVFHYKQLSSSLHSSQFLCLGFGEVEAFE